MINIMKNKEELITHWRLLSKKAEEYENLWKSSKNIEGRPNRSMADVCAAMSVIYKQCADELENGKFDPLPFNF